MKKLLIPLVALSLYGCHTYKWSASHSDNMLIGTWEQQGITLEFKTNGHYQYRYADGNYSYVQSGKFRYFPKRDSMVLYNYYPDAYTNESKHEYWDLSKLTPDSLEVRPYKMMVRLDSDTLNTDNNAIEVFTRKK